jgi:hypothetical protein
VLVPLAIKGRTLPVKKYFQVVINARGASKFPDQCTVAEPYWFAASFVLETTRECPSTPPSLNRPGPLLPF